MSTAAAKPLKMSDTALKFGPEWLRALSHGDSAVSPPPSPGLGVARYKLAEHRYGREEMLALFDKTVKAPDDLAGTPPLFVEKTQLPLALIQMTEEEMRMWQRGVNSDVVLKLMGRGSGPSAGSGVPPGGAASRGRGGSMDRGRGRGRGMGSGVGVYNRGTSYEDEGGEHARREGSSAGYGRGARPFERSQSASDRGWVERSERNGEEWNGSATSPRKEFGRPLSDNWRSREAKERERADAKEDDDGWRTAVRGERWGRSGWRNERERDEREGDKGDRFGGKGDRDSWEGSERERHRGWEEENRGQTTAFFGNKRQGHRRGWDENDTLPEWAAEDLPGGGTFDSSGAFRGETWSDDDDPEVKKKSSVEKIAEEDVSELQEDEQSICQSRSNGTDVSETLSKESSLESQLSEGGNTVQHGMIPGSSPVRNICEPPSSSIVETIPDSYVTEDPDKQVRLDDDSLEHAQAVASTLVAQLVEDEDQPKEITIPNHSTGMDQWFYRDPQGEVQGPFNSSEMAEWFNSGYFTMALSVRRACDERFVQLGELTKMWGNRLPFLPGPSFPPIKALEVNPVVADQEKFQLFQQQLLQQQLFQQQMMQQQIALRQQSVVSKLAQMEGWNALSPVQQQQLINQQMMAIPPHAPSLVGSDPLLQQLRVQMEAQAKLQAEMLQRKDPVQSLVTQMQQQHIKPPEPVLEQPVSMKQDPIQVFFQQILGQTKPTISKSTTVPNNSNKLEIDPIQSLLQQVQWNTAQSNSVRDNGVDTQGNHVAPGFHGMPPGPGLVPWPPQTLPMGVPLGVPSGHFSVPVETPPSVWDLENAKVEENKRLLEQQQLVEMRRREEEEKRKKEEEERKRREKEAKEKEEERARAEELRREAEARQAEELRRREIERQQLEEKFRKEEELRQQRLEEERIRREDERAAEQQRRQQEALQRLQEQQAVAQAQARAAQQAAQQANQQASQQTTSRMATSLSAPWAQQQQQQQQQHQVPESPSLVEIQTAEEKEMKERAAQMQKMEQNARAAATLLQQQQQQVNAMKLRWAQQNTNTTAKSLAEIQAEEAAQLARQKEKERVEKSSQQVNLNVTSPSVWGPSHTNTAWTGRTAASVVSQSSSASSSWKSTPIGFWEEPVTVTKPQPVPVAKPTPVPAKSGQQQATTTTTTTVTANTNKKNKSNKEEETVRKLFSQSTEQTDGFSQWCHEYLKKVQAQIDVPTFVAFLKDVESPFEVQDYVRSYLGEGKDAKEFSRQFLERRSRWRQSQRGVQHYEEDNMCIPAKAVNPGQTSDFHEVKSKSKKSKKKMQKVDASLLGFSVSASTDRINVGERDFVDGM